MKKALVEQSGRVAQVEAIPFPVAPTLVWMDCGDEVRADAYYFDGTRIIPIPPRPAVVQMKRVQWLFSELVQPGVISDIVGNPPTFSWCSESLPYTVPADHWLGITYAQLGSKFTDGGANARASYLLVQNVFSLPDNIGELKPTSPIIVPPSTVLAFQFINNDAEQQWMTGIVQGVLIPHLAGESYKDALAKYS